MAHYFDTDKDLVSKPFDIHFELDGKPFCLTSDEGVFSKDKLDTGTRILLETMLEKQAPVQSILDLGAGIGVVGVVLSSFWNCDVIGIEVNERSANLARANYEKYHVKGEILNQDGTEPVEGKYDVIALNPPIRAGKEVIYSLFQTAKSALVKNGSLWIVMRKQHGAASAVKELESMGMRVSREAREKGFWILQAKLSD